MTQKVRKLDPAPTPLARACSIAGCLRPATAEIVHPVTAVPYAWFCALHDPWPCAPRCFCRAARGRLRWRDSAALRRAEEEAGAAGGPDASRRAASTC